MKKPLHGGDFDAPLTHHLDEDVGDISIHIRRDIGYLREDPL